jgi:hypothetical protein
MRSHRSTDMNEGYTLLETLIAIAATMALLIACFSFGRLAISTIDRLIDDSTSSRLIVIETNRLRDFARKDTRGFWSAPSSLPSQLPKGILPVYGTSGIVIGWKTTVTTRKGEKELMIRAERFPLQAESQ